MGLTRLAIHRPLTVLMGILALVSWAAWRTRTSTSTVCHRSQSASSRSPARCQMPRPRTSSARHRAHRERNLWHFGCSNRHLDARARAARRSSCSWPMATIRRRPTSTFSRRWARARARLPANATRAGGPQVRPERVADPQHCLHRRAARPAVRRRQQRDPAPTCSRCPGWARSTSRADSNARSRSRSTTPSSRRTASRWPRSTPH